jgi:hypothetical protein
MSAENVEDFLSLANQTRPYPSQSGWLLNWLCFQNKAILARSLFNA